MDLSEVVLLAAAEAPGRIIRARIALASLFAGFFWFVTNFLIMINNPWNLPTPPVVMILWFVAGFLLTLLSLNTVSELSESDPFKGWMFIISAFIAVMPYIIIAYWASNLSKLKVVVIIVASMYLAKLIIRSGGEKDGDNKV